MRLLHLPPLWLCKTASYTNFPFSSPEKKGFYEQMLILNWFAKFLSPRENKHLPQRHMLLLTP